MSEPDWKNFAKAVLTDWPTGDMDGAVLFDLSLQYGMIQEVLGGYNSDHHIDAEGICPEEGDPWYEYTFRGEAGPGLYSITNMNNRIEELEAKLAKAVDALTPSGETKAAYISEVETDCPIGGSHTVSWTATKEIMKMIARRAELKGETNE